MAMAAMATKAVVVVVLAVLGGAAADFNHVGDARLTQTNFYFPHTPDLDVINSDFKLTVVATATNEAYPQSYTPLFFESNPTGPGTQGFSIGHGISNTFLELRFSDGSQISVARFTYRTPLSIIERNTFEVTCVKITNARVCSVTVNGEATRPPSRSFPIAGDVYNQNGALFGNIWGWRFVGVLHQIRVESAADGCVHFGNSVVQPNQISPDNNRAIEFRCPTTVTSTTVTTTTVSTATTNTILQNLGRNHSDLQDVTDGLRTALAASESAAEQTRSRLQEAENQVQSLQQQVNELRSMLVGLGATTQPNTVIGDSPASPCAAVDASSGDVRPPAIQTAADGRSVEITACQGGVTFHTLECDFNPCLVKQDVASIKTKLEALGN